MDPAFSFQVMSKGVIININPDIKFDKLKKSLSDHVNQAADFFAGVDIYVNISQCKFKISQLEKIIDIIKKYNQVKNIYFTDEQQEKKEKKTISNDTVLLKKTLRSGQRIKYPTNIVVIGDINPGAEVIAGGDVIVLGKLRGVVHAGAGGFKEAQVIALKLEPTQLRIANIISRPPEHEKKLKNIKPEKAYIKENSIIVENLTG
ncbi:MAG: septum site-determining protein MinC [Halanaerobiales bacterium]